MGSKPTSFSSSGNKLDIGAFLTLINGSPKLGGKDYSGVYLTYSTGAGSVTPSGSTPAGLGGEVNTAIQQLMLTDPGAASALNAYFGTGPGASTTTLKAVGQSIMDSNYNFGKVQAPIVATTKATLDAALNAQANAIEAGLSSATASQQANAMDNIGNTIESWNYTQQQKNYLNDIVGRLVTINGDHIVNQNALLDILRGERPSGLGKATDAKIKADYEAAFPGLTSYNKQPGAIHMSESQYTQYTSGIMNSATQYGAPMPSQKQIGELLNGHVSATEYQQRVTDIYAQVSNADQGVKNILEQQYGIKQNDLMHYFMDPKNALQNMQRQVASAEIQDYAKRVGLTSGITTAGSTQLADMAKLAATQSNQTLGYGIGQIQSSLLSASRDVSLTRATPGQGAPTVDTTTLIGSQLAGYGGTSQAAASRQVQLAEQAKTAPFEKGGGYTETSKGVTGVGYAAT